MNGKNDRRDRKNKNKVKPLNFISGGYDGEEHHDDAIVVESEKNQTNYKEKETNNSDGSSPDVIVIESQVAGPSVSGGKSGSYKESSKKGEQEEKVIDYAGWEKHSKGIGSKLMKKMGHEEGKGLGKSAQGIYLPIEAFRRLGRGTIGCYGSETKEIHAQNENKYKIKPWLREIDKNKEKDKENDKHDHKNKPWMKYKLRQIERSKQQNKKVTQQNMYVDKKQEKVNKRNGIKNVHSNNINPYDIHSSNKRLNDRRTNGRHSKNSRSKERDSEDNYIRDRPSKRAICRDKDVDIFSDSPTDVELIPLPSGEIVIDEDEASCGSMLDQIMHTAKRNKRRKLVIEESMAQMSEEHDRLVEECQRDDLQVSSILQLNQRVNKMYDLCFKHSSLSSNDDVTIIDPPSSPLSFRFLLESCFQSMEDLKIPNSDSVSQPLLETIIFLKSTISDIFKDWDPLQNPDHGLLFMQELQHFINTQASSSDAAAQSIKQDHFDSYTHDLILPNLRVAINTWSIKEPSVMLKLMDMWSPLMEKRVVNQLHNLIFNVKMRKGIREVDNSSLKDVIMPWVPVLGKKIRTLPQHILKKINWCGDFEVVEVLSGDDSD